MKKEVLVVIRQYSLKVIRTSDQYEAVAGN